MGLDLANITNSMIIFLFIKNLYNQNIRRRVAGMKVVNTLDSFKLAHHNLLELKKYGGLVYNEEQVIGKISQFVHLSKGVSGAGKINQSNRSTQNMTNRNYTYWGTC